MNPQTMRIELGFYHTWPDRLYEKETNFIRQYSCYVHLFPVIIRQMRSC